MDLDGFKGINDQLGHQTGDQVLVGIADQLTRAAPDSAVVARVGGDEFAVLLPEIGSEESTLKMVERLRDEFIRPIVVDGFPLSVGVSIGLAFVPTDGTHARRLAERSRCRDVPRQALPHRCREPQHRRGAIGDRSVSACSVSCRDAISGDQLRVHYQPLTRFLDGIPKSMEALAALAAPDTRARAAGRLHLPRRAHRSDRPADPVRVDPVDHRRARPSTSSTSACR